MEGEGSGVCPASELAGFGAEYVRDGGVGVHESDSNNKEECEAAPPDSLEFPEDTVVADALEPEVLCVEVCQREEAAAGDERAQRPE